MQGAVHKLLEQEIPPRHRPIDSLRDQDALRKACPGEGQALPSPSVAQFRNVRALASSVERSSG